MKYSYITCWLTVIFSLILRGLFFDKLSWEVFSEAAYYSGLALFVHWFVESGSDALREYIHRATGE